MSRIVTEPFKAGDSYWTYNVLGSSSTTAPLPPDLTRYWNSGSGGNIGDPGNDIPLPSSLTAFSAGMYFKPIGITGGNHYLMTFKNGSTTLCGIRISATTFKLKIENAALAQVGSDGPSVIANNLWRHVGVVYVLHASAGTIEVYLDDSLEISFTGNTAFSQSSINVIQGARCYNTGTSAVGMSSLYVNDTTGLAPENAFEGVVKMYQVLAVSDSAITEWLKSSGSDAFALIGDVPPNLATYIYSSTNGARQLVVPPAHGLVAPAFIRSVTARWIAAKATGGRINPTFRFNGGAVLPTSDRAVGVSPGILLARRTTNESGANIALTDTFEVGVNAVIP